MLSIKKCYIRANVHIWSNILFFKQFYVLECSSRNNNIIEAISNLFCRRPRIEKKKRKYWVGGVYERSENLQFGFFFFSQEFSSGNSWWKTKLSKMPFHLKFKLKIMILTKYFCTPTFLNMSKQNIKGIREKSSTIKRLLFGW